MTVPATPERTASETRLTPALSGLAVLLAISIFINYVDRGNLSVAAPLLKQELRLTPSQLGILFSSFFWTYSTFQIVSGWLVDRFAVNAVLALGFFVWSMATLATGMVRGFALLLFMRLLLGIGESVAYPSYSKIISRHFSELQRGRANSIICAGQASGPAFGVFLGGILLPHVGWRGFFVVLGTASALWLLPWMSYMKRERRAEQDTSPSPVADGRLERHAESASIAQILRHRSAWGSFAGLFAYNYVWYFFITWLPTYLTSERHFSLQRMSGITGMALLILAGTALGSGWLSDRWIAAGGTPTRVRKTFTGVGPLLASVIVLLGIVQSHTLAIGLLLLTCVGLGMCTSNLWAVTQTLAGPATSGKWTGLQNFAGNLAGWITPALIGIIVERTGNYLWAFVITGAVSLLGSASWIFLIGPIESVQWGKKNESVTAAL